ncbi:hypothetical protein D3C72_2420320 [compost metagenome]
MGERRDRSQVKTSVLNALRGAHDVIHHAVIEPLLGGNGQEERDGGNESKPDQHNDLDGDESAREDPPQR